MKIVNRLLETKIYANNNNLIFITNSLIRLGVSHALERK